jgi:hypothetical protein
MKREQEILNELQEIAPFLIPLRKKKNMVDDEAYFSKMQDDVLLKIMNQDVNDIPNGYFQSMQQEVIDKVDHKNKTKTVALSSYIKWTAAACVGLSLLWIPFRNMDLNKNELAINNKIEINFQNNEEVDYMIEYLNSDADFEYWKSISSEENIPSMNDNEYLFTDEEIELLNEIM